MPLNRHLCMADGSVKSAECSGWLGQGRRVQIVHMVAADASEDSVELVVYADPNPQN